MTFFRDFFADQLDYFQVGTILNPLGDGNR